MSDTDIRNALLEATRVLPREPSDSGFTISALLDRAGLQRESMPPLSHPRMLVVDPVPRRTHEPSPGDELGRYVVEEEIGRGGMGAVYSAWDPDIDRRVAVKVLTDIGEAPGDLLARFLREAKITGQLEHPNIVPVHDIGVTGTGLLFIIMKRIQGKTLKAALAELRSENADARRSWTRFRLMQVFLQVCSAVDYAHSRGVLHRDLKPANVMLGAFGEVQVLDWGVAALFESDSARKAFEGMIVGTLGYMSPEQLEGRAEIGPASDVWSLGAILYELLTLRPAFPGSTQEEIAQRMATTPPRFDGADGASPVPQSLQQICHRALAHDPAQRHPSARAMMDELQTALDGAQRKAQAAEYVAAARDEWKRYIDLQRRLRASRARGGSAEELAREHADLEQDRTECFGRAVAACERALSLDPDNAEARSIMAQAAGSVYRRLRS